MIHKRKLHTQDRGIGMTSQGTRDRLVQTLRREGIKDERVLKAITQVPRHKFVDEALSSRAYENTALPIGLSQTISQPWIVARMTEALLDSGSPAKVLEVGTGSGYQAAILASLCKQVWSIEIIPSLGHAAAERLTRLGYTNIDVHIGDGFAGWPEQAPFDGIIVAATGDELPPPLLSQLKLGGRLVMPLRNKTGNEILVVAYKDRDGNITTQDILPVRFVPLTRGEDDDGEASD